MTPQFDFNNLPNLTTNVWSEIGTPSALGHVNVLYVMAEAKINKKTEDLHTKVRITEANEAHVVKLYFYGSSKSLEMIYAPADAFVLATMIAKAALAEMRSETEQVAALEYFVKNVRPNEPQP